MVGAIQQRAEMKLIAPVSVFFIFIAVVDVATHASHCTLSKVGGIDPIDVARNLLRKSLRIAGNIGRSSVDLRENGQIRSQTYARAHRSAT